MNDALSNTKAKSLLDCDLLLEKNKNLILI